MNILKNRRNIAPNLTKKIKLRESSAYVIQKLRRQILKNIAEEHIILLAMLYGNLLEDGKRSVRDYKGITNHDINTELNIRTLLLQSQRINSEKQKKEKEKRAELAALEELKLFQT